MSVFDRILNGFGYSNRAEVEEMIDAGIKATLDKAPGWLQATSEFEALQDVNNLHTTRSQLDLSRRLSWVWAAREHVSGQVAGTPFQVLEQDENEEKKKILNHEFEILLQKPNPTQSRFEILTDTSSNYQIAGNSFWWMNKANEFAKPDEIFTIPPHMIQPVPDGKMFLKGYAYDPGDGVPVALEPWEIVHFKRYNPFSRYWGQSPIAALAVISIGDIAMQKHNTEFFTGLGAKLPGMLTFKDSIPDPEWEEIKADVKSNSEKRNLMMLRNTGEDVNWLKVGMTQAEMEFIQGRKMNEEEIYKVLAPGLFSWLEPNSTEANSKTGKEAFDELAVWPINQAIQEKITIEVLPLYGEGLLGEFDDVRPVDKAIKLAEQAAAEKVSTIDEIRKTFLNLDPLEDTELGGQIVSLASATSQETEDNQDSFSEEEEPTREEEDEQVKFRRYTRRGGDVDDFVFRYLNESRQKALKAEFESNDSKRLDLLISMSKVLKESVSV